MLSLKRGLAGDAPTGGKSFKQSWLSDKGVRTLYMLYV